MVGGGHYYIRHTSNVRGVLVFGIIVDWVLGDGAYVTELHAYIFTVFKSIPCVKYYTYNTNVCAAERRYEAYVTQLNIQNYYLNKFHKRLY